MGGLLWLHLWSFGFICLWCFIHPEGSFLKAEEPSLEKKIETDYLIGEITLGEVPFVLYSFTMSKVLVHIFSPIQIHWEAKWSREYWGTEISALLKGDGTRLQADCDKPTSDCCPETGRWKWQVLSGSLIVGFLFPFQSCPCICVLGFYKRLWIFLVSFPSTNWVGVFTFNLKNNILIVVPRLICC